jgi:hypothetical protein
MKEQLINPIIKGFTYKEISVKDLKNHPSNTKFFTQMTEQKAANQHGKTISSTEELGESIKKNGIHTPLIVTNKNLILSGNRRFLWAIKYGIEKVKCNVVNNDLTLEQEELLIIEYNLLNRKFSGSSIKILRNHRMDIYNRISGIMDRVLEPKNSPHRLKPEDLEKNGVSIATAKADLAEMRRLASRKLNVMRLGEKGINHSSLKSFNQRMAILVSEYKKANNGTRKEYDKTIKDFNKQILKLKS